MSEPETIAPEKITLRGLGRYARFQLTAAQIVAKGEAKAQNVYNNFFGSDAWDHDTLDDYRHFIPGLDLEHNAIAQRHARLQQRLGIKVQGQGKRGKRALTHAFA